MPDNPLRYAMDYGSPDNPLTQGSPTWADAATNTVQNVGDYIARQRALPPQSPAEIGGIMANALLMGTTAPGFRAFHGSPHSFDRFDASKIGTGEGAQAYGHGLYFAEREGVARDYRDKLSATPLDGLNDALLAFQPYKPDGMAPTVDNLRAVLAQHPNKFVQEAAGNDAVVRDLSTMINGHDLTSNTHSGAAVKAASRIDDFFSPKSSGHMNEVNIGSDPAHFLDYDKPLSEQSQHVKDALAKVPWAEPYLKTSFTGGQIVPQTAEGAQQLRAAGIPGIRYLDAGSRGQGGTSNTVVFDPATIEILRKYGIAGLIGGGAAGAATQQGEQ